jgi:hypothetical protein
LARRVKDAGDPDPCRQQVRGQLGSKQTGHAERGLAIDLQQAVAEAPATILVSAPVDSGFGIEPKVLGAPMRRILSQEENTEAAGERVKFSSRQRRGCPSSGNRAAQRSSADRTG